MPIFGTEVAHCLIGFLGGPTLSRETSTDEDSVTAPQNEPPPIRRERWTGPARFALAMFDVLDHQVTQLRQELGLPAAGIARIAVILVGLTVVVAIMVSVVLAAGLGPVLLQSWSGLASTR